MGAVTEYSSTLNIFFQLARKEHSHTRPLQIISQQSFSNVMAWNVNLFFAAAVFVGEVLMLEPQRMLSILLTEKKQVSGINLSR